MNSNEKMKFTNLISQLEAGLESGVSSNRLVATLSEAQASLKDSPELVDFFKCISDFLSVELRVVHNGLEIQKAKLSPIQNEVIVPLLETGLYQVFHDGRLAWQQELMDEDIYAQEMELAAADKPVEPLISNELSHLRVWLSLFSGLESGTLVLTLKE